MSLTKPLTFSFLVIFKNIVFFGILSANFRQKKLLAIINCKKTWFILIWKTLKATALLITFLKRAREIGCALTCAASEKALVNRRTVCGDNERVQEIL